MMRIEKTKGRATTAQRIGVDERKGKGHPDSICDAVMEAFSPALCREGPIFFELPENCNGVPTGQGISAVGSVLPWQPD